MPSLCIGAETPTPRRPASGSVLSLAVLCQHVVLRDPGKLMSCFDLRPSSFTHGASHDAEHDGQVLRRFCTLMGAFVISPLPPLWLELLLHISRASSLHRHYPASPLLLALPPPSRRPPISWWSQLYGLLLHGFPHGTRRVSPVAQCVLAIVLSLSPRQSVSSHQSVCHGTCCLHPLSESSASGV